MQAFTNHLFKLTAVFSKLEYGGFLLANVSGSLKKRLGHSPAVSLSIEQA
nr:hypothetical protein [uncultured Kingella sp.]